MRLTARLILFFFCIPVTRVQADFQDTFETSEPSWQLHHSDCRARILVQKRQFTQAHSGAGCEFLDLQMDRGTYAHLTYKIPHLRVIDELEPSLWIKSNRKQLQLLARVVLPRTLDSKSGEPLKFLIRGSQYEFTGQWQRLSLKRCRQAMMQQIPSLRSQFGSTVNPKQAYIDLIVVNAYGGRGSTQIWIDDLKISTPIVESGDPAKMPARPDPAGSTLAQLTANKKAASLRDPLIDLQGTLLLVEKRPFFPRIIEYNGESFQWLQKLGFNTIALKTQPTVGQIAEARRLNLWLTVPPVTDSAGPPQRTTNDRCLAFDLGSNLTVQQYPAISRTAASLRDLGITNTPLLSAAPATMLKAYSRQCDLLRLDWDPLNRSIDLNSATQSLRKRAASLELGTSYWVTIPTQPTPALIAQWTAFGTRHLFPREVEPEQLRFLTFSALSSGACGLYFRSWSRLDAPDTSTEIRSHTLELINQQLRLIEPWLAGGVFLGDVNTGAADVRASLWQTDRAKLLIILRPSARQQYVTSPVKSKSLSFDVPGTSITYRPYQLYEDGPRALQPQRGNQTPVTMLADERICLVVLTPDQLVRDYLHEQTNANRQRQANLRLKLAIDRHSQFKQITAQFPLAVQTSQLRTTIQTAEQHLSQSQAFLNRGDRTSANQFTAKANQSLRQLRWDLWNEAVRFFPSPVSSPYCVCFQTLPNHWELSEQMKNGRWGTNLLKGSDFEDLQVLQQAGWVHHQVESAGYLPRVELSANQPHAGNYSLHLSNQADPTANPLDSTRVPRVQITTGPMNIKVGTRLRIHGWAKVSPQPHQHSHGLVIHDSLGGPTLGDRLRPTIGWQEFLLYRAASRNGPFQLTFSLEGQGEAWLDSVSLQVLESTATVESNLPAP